MVMIIIISKECTSHSLLIKSNNIFSGGDVMVVWVEEEEKSVGGWVDSENGLSYRCVVNEYYRYIFGMCVCGGWPDPDGDIIINNKKKEDFPLFVASCGMSLWSSSSLPSSFNCLLHENIETLFSDLHTNYQHKKNSWLLHLHPRIKLSRKKE